MAKRLIVMRHAKSSWSSGAATDHERPLNKRGRKDAPRVAAAIAKLGWAPDQVVSSTAERTRETWQRMSPTFPDTEAEFCEDLYHAGHKAVIANLTGRDADTILILGHNPGWEHLASSLAGHYIEMTTANAVLLESSEQSWDDAFGSGKWHLETIIRPRELG